jgi:hypothetical protein
VSERKAVPVGCVRAVRVGHGGNCSSVGSVIDTLFLGAAAGGAMLAAICAALEEEPVRVVGEPAPQRTAEPASDPDAEREEREEERP